MVLGPAENEIPSLCILQSLRMEALTEAALLLGSGGR